jgi:hypothetical protein
MKMINNTHNYSRGSKLYCLLLRDCRTDCRTKLVVPVCVVLSRKETKCRMSNNQAIFKCNKASEHQRKL